MIMADPARIKTEGTPERATSANEEHSSAKSEETEDVTAKSTDENKESSSQEQPKLELKSVSSRVYLSINVSSVMHECYNETILSPLLRYIYKQ